MDNKKLKDFLQENNVKVVKTEIPAGHTAMQLDCTKGKAGEKVFAEYLRSKNLNFKNVTAQHKTDFIVNDTIYEVKASYKDNDILIIETISDDGVKSGTGKQKKGWWYTSCADYFVFISLKTLVKIQLPNNPETKELFKNIKEKYSEVKNKKKSYDDFGNDWQSWYIPVPLKEFEGHYEFLN